MEGHMKLIRSLVMVVIWVGFLGSSYGYTFYVGGKDGWVVRPRESYNHWAERNRFQVNDTLVFKYKQGSNSVLVVNGDDYNKCNKTHPTLALHNENSTFKLERSGPFFFISGHGDNCENGQKLIIVVMAVRHHMTHKSQPTASPMVAPSPMRPNVDHFNTNAPAPAPAPTSSTMALSVGGGGCVGLMLALSLNLLFSMKGF